ncbi:MAG TPA: hypothetical protein VGP63_06285 [Planctomycetaceae bacterium]|nr:hypothetical protein [Planctomycetaceae bacterium]
MKGRRLLVLLLLLAVGQTPCRGAAEVAPLGRFDYLPYQVSVSIAFSRDAEVTDEFRQRVCSALRTRLEQTFGAAWVLPSGTAIRINDRLTPPSELGLERLTYATAAEQLSGVACDKAYFLTVSREGPRWSVAGREWDHTLQTVSTLAVETTVERRRVSDAALAVIKRLFSPLLIVSDADRQSKSAVLVIRAGAIPFGDPKFEPLRAGDILRPAFRFLDSKRNLRSIQSVPWTYLVLEQDGKGRSQIKASVVSTYRAPLAANMRRRVEALAVKVRPELAETHLKLVAGKTPAQPQGGLFVTISDLPAEKSSGQAEKQSGTPPAEPVETRLLSDRRGEVTIPVDARHPVVRLEVHSGSAILARRPFVPGLEADVTLEVADDRVRLGTEQEIDILESQLIETVAKRGALLARTRGALSRSDIAGAQQLLAEVERMPPSDEYLKQLNKIRVLALEAAQKRGDRVAERRIEDLCTKTLERITQYLPEDRVSVFKEEIASLLNAKKAAAELQSAPIRREETAPRVEAAPQAEKAPLRRGPAKKLQAPATEEKTDVPAQPSGI